MLISLLHLIATQSRRGEDEGGGLNGAQRLNGLNVLNQQTRAPCTLNSSRTLLLRSAPVTPFTRRIVIWIGGFLRWA